MSVPFQPPGYHSVTPYLVVRGAAEALAFYAHAFGADAGTPAPVVDGVSFAQPLRWQGRWLDTATGIYDVRNRQWAPELGAFLSADEFRFFSGSGTLWSWPGQNPVRLRDRTGQFTDTEVANKHTEYGGENTLQPGGFIASGGGSVVAFGAASGSFGQFVGNSLTPSMTFDALSVGGGVPLSFGIAGHIGVFFGTAEEFAASKAVFIGAGEGLGVELVLLIEPGNAAKPGQFKGILIGAGPAIGAPVWFGAYPHSDVKLKPCP